MDASTPEALFGQPRAGHSRAVIVNDGGTRQVRIGASAARARRTVRAASL
jgi:hypothetical protein